MNKLIVMFFLLVLSTPVYATPITITGGGEVTDIDQPGGLGPDQPVTHEFSMSDVVDWNFTYDDDWLSGTGVEILALGTDSYLLGTAVDGYRCDISGEIVVGSEVISDFRFISLMFEDGILSDLAFLSSDFDTPWNVDGDLYVIDLFRIGTSGTAWYGFDYYNPEFQSTAASVEWMMTSIGEGGEIMVRGVLENADPVPEPATISLLGVGILGLVGFSRRKKRLH